MSCANCGCEVDAVVEGSALKFSELRLCANGCGDRLCDECLPDHTDCAALAGGPPDVAGAVALFDQITGASYYGFGFRQVLINDAEAREAARALISRLRFHGARGLDSDESGS